MRWKEVKKNIVFFCFSFPLNVKCVKFGSIDDFFYIGKLNVLPMNTLL